MSDNDTMDFRAMLTEMVNRGGANGGTRIGADDDIREHANGERYIAVPKGMAMEHLADIARRKAEELNTEHTFMHQTKYRPNDGAHAAAVAIKKMFGLTIGKATMTMFGPRPPEYRNIAIAHNEHMDVPWGRLEIPALPGAVFNFTDMRDESGPVFTVIVESPKKHKTQIDEFFRALDQELATNSIYRGKPVIGAHELKFMDVSRFKSSEIVFADDVQRTLDAAVFGLIERTQATIDAGLSTKRAVLAFGPYGTGKSSLGLITAQRAQAQGWTFLSARAGRDKLKPVLQTAALYEPAVVFIEDIDAHTPSREDKDGISEVLDLFDGIAAKNAKMLVIMTTNHIEKVPAGMLRPGRVDYCVEISGLDRGGVERLVKAVIRPDLLAGNVDYDAVFELMSDWQPAWVKAACDRAQSFAIARGAATDALAYGITTEDLTSAAKSLLPQLDLMSNALEGYSEPELETVFHTQVVEAVKAGLNNTAFVDRDDDQVYALRTEEPKGHHWIAQP